MGFEGASDRLPPPPGVEAEGFLERLAVESTAIGFLPLDPENLTDVTVAFLCDGWGEPEDLELRHRIEEAIDDALGWTGNGHCEGGSIGRGGMEVFCRVLDRDTGAAAIRRVVGACTGRASTLK